MDWIKPKTDWVETDRFNIQDYNRIKNNLLFLYEVTLDYYTPYVLDKMGGDISSYEQYWNVNYFNAIEKNLDTIANVVGLNFGQRTTFYPNGLFITFDELNRIESASLEIYENIEKLAKLRVRLPFGLGRYKEVKKI